VALRHFTVNVPNPSDGAAAATLRLEPLGEAELAQLGVDLPPERLTLRRARLTTTASATTLGGCAAAIWSAIVAFISWLLRRPVPFRRPTLNVRLDPRSSANVRVAIDVAGGTGAAALNLVDRRGGKIVGGVTLLVVEGPMNAPGEPIPARDPCPIDLVDYPFWLPAESLIDSPRYAGPAPAGREIDLVAWVTNPTNSRLEEATAYLEHLGGADAAFRPSTWNLGDLEPGARFPLRWRIEPRAGTTSQRPISVVVQAKGFDPIRLRPVLEIGPVGSVELVVAKGGGSQPD
jgi:hypothetical protein